MQQTAFQLRVARVLIVVAFLSATLLLLQQGGISSVRADAPFSTNIQINNDPANTSSQETPSIAVDKWGTVHAIWADDRDGDWNIYYSQRSWDTGTWSPSVKANDDTTTNIQDSPSIAVDKWGNVYAVWRDLRDDPSNSVHSGNANIYFSRLVTGTLSWGSNIKLSDDMNNTGQHGPVIAVDSSGNAHVAWWDRRNSPPNTQWMFSDIYYTKLAFGSSTPGPNQRINDDPAGSTGHLWPQIALDTQDTVHLVWTDYRGGAGRPYYSKLPAGSSTWTSNQRIVDDFPYTNAIAVDGDGNMQVLYQDINFDVFNVRWDTLVGSWGAPVKVNDQPKSSGSSGTLVFTISVKTDSSGKVYAAWTDYRTAGPGGTYCGNIYFSTLEKGAGSWAANVRVNDGSSTLYHRSPSLALDDAGHVYVAWQDYRNGTRPDIFFAAAAALPYWPTNNYHVYLPAILR